MSKKVQKNLKEEIKKQKEKTGLTPELGHPTPTAMTGHNNSNSSELEDVIEIDVTKIVIYLLLLLVPLIIFLQTKDFWFVWDDDRYHLQPHPYIQQLTWDNLVKIWTEIYVGMYIPVSYTVWGLLKPLGQMLSPTPVDFYAPLYHLTNVVLHILNVILVFKIVGRFVKNQWAVCLAALLFAVHPIQAEIVAWISELRGLLATFFAFLSLELYLHYHSEQKNKKSGIYIMSIICFVLGMMSKPSVVVMPAIFASYHYFFEENNLKKIFNKTFFWFGLAAIFIILTRIAQPFSATQLNSPLLFRPLLWMDAINFYLYKIIWPLDLTSFYARTPEHAIADNFLYIEWIIPVILGSFLWSIRQKQKIIVLSAAIFIVGFLPTSGLVGFDFQRWSTVADRYIYISMLGISLIVAFGIDYFPKWHPKQEFAFLKNVGWIFICAIIFLAALRSYSFQIPTWKDSVVLWDHCIKLTPGEAQAYNNRGDGLSKHAGKLPNPEERKHFYERALTDFDEAIRLDKVYLQAYANRGSVLNNLARYEEAIRDFTSAISLNGMYVDAYQKRAIVYYNKGDYPQSAEDIKNLQKIGAPVNMNLVKALEAKGINVQLSNAPPTISPQTIIT